MLTISRSENQSIKIGDNITIYVTRAGNNEVKLMIDAPREIPVMRDNAKLRRPKP